MLKITGVINNPDVHLVQQINTFRKAVKYAYKCFKNGQTEAGIKKELTKFYLPDYIYCESAMEKAKRIIKIHGKYKPVLWGYRLDSIGHPLIFARRNLKLYYSIKDKRYYLDAIISYKKTYGIAIKLNIQNLKKIPVEFDFNTRRLLKDYLTPLFSSLGMKGENEIIVPLQKLELIYGGKALYITGKLKEEEKLDINERAVAAGIMAGLITWQGGLQSAFAQDPSVAPPALPSFVNSNTQSPSVAPPTLPSFVNSNTQSPSVAPPTLPSFVNSKSPAPTVPKANIKKKNSTYKPYRKSSYRAYRPISYSSYYHPVYYPKLVISGNICTVSPGNTLSHIAYKVLGSSERWNEIYELNKDKISVANLIYPGQKLTLPTKIAVNTSNSTTSATTETSTTTPASTQTTGKYTVKTGECLWDIAGKELKDPYKWVEIYKLNKGTIGNPDLIDTGMQLIMPKV